MPKLKTNRSAAKRFKFTKSGKVKRASAFMRHILSKKSPKKKRTLRGTSVLSECDEKEVIKLLPYGGK
ncbi:MAG: 50S ribosomal protein L35 [Leptospiraceae bacterium]|nr:50S ribosomal protein L35 [Leptospiraceae bacterium]MCP5498400.1 50S ribosomal protein L35 [Leptospiraceae bacterium]